jgi:hypothetical protein
VTSGAGPGERGLAGGLFVTAQQIGLAIGLAVLATVAAARTSTHGGLLVAGYKAAFLVSTGISAAAVLIVAIQMRTRAGPKGTAWVRRYQLVRSLGGRGCGASSLAYIWMRSFRGSYIGRRDTVAG